MTTNVPATRTSIERVTEGDGAQGREAELKALLRKADNHVGNETVHHLKEMYPAALAAVTPNAKRSLTGFVSNRVYSAIVPLLTHAAAVRQDRADMLQKIQDLRDLLSEREQEIEALRRR